MAIQLATRFAPYVDELFTKESRIDLLTNRDFDFDGAKTVNIYKVGTVDMTDYGRGRLTRVEAIEKIYNHEKIVVQSLYGDIVDLDATTETFTLRKDRSFTFMIDKLDQDETVQQLEASSALARQQRQVIIPEIETYMLDQILKGAGTTPEPVTLTPENIFSEIIKATNTLDNALVPDNGRVLVVTPDTYSILKQSKDIVLNTEVGQDMRLKGVLSNLDGATVIKVPSSRLPEKFGFAMVHPSATVGVTKLADFMIHENPPFINGHLIEGRIVYDAFVLENKKKAIYLQKTV